MRIRKKLTGMVLCVVMVVTIIPLQSFGTELPFQDVSDSAWYYNDVKMAYESGLIDGMDDRTFSPDSHMTYAQAVKLAACMNQKYMTGSVTLESGTPYWYSSYVAYAKANNIIDKDYDWDASATRAGYAEIFANALPEEAYTGINLVTDDAIPDFSSNHPLAAGIYKLYRAGILMGVNKTGLFLPLSRIKRSEVSAVVTRMMNVSERKHFTLGSTTKTFKATFDSNGGSEVEAQIILENGNVTKPEEPTKAGYDFGGWYTDEKRTVQYDFDVPVDGDITLYAKWTSKSTPFQELIDRVQQKAQEAGK